VKVFWSWQSDRDGKTSRHFVREVLKSAIQELKEEPDIEEPTGRSERGELHLDQDRQGVSGSPDLAPLIFKKISSSTVFVADVTFVGEIVDGKQEIPKKLINSNVAIEYGYALNALSDEAILLVQNTHYGDRNSLPFDLRHKAGPIEYRLAPDANKDEIVTETKKLKATLKEALRLCLLNAPKPSIELKEFVEIKPTINRAYFWEPSKSIAQYVRPNYRNFSETETTEFRFNERRVFYFRLIPTSELPSPLKLARLHELAQRRQIPVMTRTLGSFTAHDNEYGSLAFELASSDDMTAFTQLFRNGEVWAVTKDLVQMFREHVVVPMVNLQNLYGDTLQRLVVFAQEQLGVSPPYKIELGAVGLRDMRLTLPIPQMQGPAELSELIHQSEFSMRRVLSDTTKASQQTIVREFVSELYDLARITYEV
jgi:hypothetical protein